MELCPHFSSEITAICIYSYAKATRSENSCITVNQMYCTEEVINNHYCADFNKKYDDDMNSF